MKLMATLAAGLLLGTAFIIILPEGIAMLLHGLQYHDDHKEGQKHKGGHEDDVHEEESHEDHEEEEVNGHLMGLSIIGGIIFMMLVNQFGPGHSHGNENGESKPKSDLDASDGFELVPVGDSNIDAAREGQSTVNAGSPTEKRQILSPVTLGFFIHACFDGIVLGIVTAGGEDIALSIVVFGALMAHKAYETITLSLILLAQGLKTLIVLVNLVLISLAAPIGALVTFFILEAGSGSSENDENTLGYCILFAGGTFIGVIFEHILPELKMFGEGRFSWIQLLIFTVGALIPLTIPHNH